MIGIQKYLKIFYACKKLKKCKFNRNKLFIYILKSDAKMFCTLNKSYNLFLLLFYP